MTDAAELAGSDRSFVIAPAGFGKTELITRSIEMTPGRSLVLTHTHSGVNALRDRLRMFGVTPDRFMVETIAGWGLRYASAYPALSGLEVERPTGAAWPQVYAAAIAVLQSGAVRKVIQQSFSGAYVDEYQDCNHSQHQIVMAIAEAQRFLSSAHAYYLLPIVDICLRSEPTLTGYVTFVHSDFRLLTTRR